MKKINKNLVGILIALIIANGIWIVYDIRKEIKYNEEASQRQIKNNDQILLDIYRKLDSLERKDAVKKSLQEKLETKMLKGSVAVYSIRQKGMGSGTVIKKTFNTMHILTCYHVIADYFTEENVLPTEKITVNYNFITYAVDVLKVDKAHDLALLKAYFNDPNLEEIKIADNTPKKGDIVYTVGNPMGSMRNISKGILSNYIDSFDEEENVTLQFYVVDALCIFGNSGGALYNEKAELIGVPARVPGYGFGAVVTNMGLCVSLDTIKEFLKGVE